MPRLGEAFGTAWVLHGGTLLCMLDTLQHVVTGTYDHRVIAWPAVQQIVAWATIQSIIPIFAQKRVVSLAAQKRIVPVAAVQRYGSAEQ